LEDTWSATEESEKLYTSGREKLQGTELRQLKRSICGQGARECSGKRGPTEGGAGEKEHEMVLCRKGRRSQEPRGREKGTQYNGSYSFLVLPKGKKDVKGETGRTPEKRGESGDMVYFKKTKS